MVGVEDVVCPGCGSENEAGRKFCGECGTALARACPSCGTANAPNVKFCGECGASLGSTTSAPIPTEEPVGIGTPAEAPVAERRLVSVLFADLVGFTTLSEARDPEEVRELLTRYFDTCRTLIARYGGTVEKFIGDAVMAVWGTPTAMEDDAERAVRAALDLTAAVETLGQEVGALELRARAGVSTGEAAVTIGAEGQGMVAGDIVNTASRIQAAALAGAVFVAEVTRRATEAAIVYEEAGVHDLKGKAEPVPLWRAIRVIGGSGGALRSTGLEAPFVGRDRELRLIKELFHAAAEEKRAHLISVVGIAGIGKSRLSWEFFKYIDGLATDMWWHRGRCLSYGEGVAYWALAEMVKGRCGILEDEEPASARGKLRATIEEHIPDPEERTWVEPRLAHLLGLEERATRDQENLFSAWRILFERLAEQDPVVMVFEDMQWADAGLLDFIEYLLDWSRTYPLFILTLARPELAEKRPGWGAGKRSFTSLYLEALSPQVMDELLSGLVPGLPDDLRERILGRAEGVPLYAVETVRMLLDRGFLAQEGNVYRPTGPIETLEVPETLHALIAARLDGLKQDERRLIQDGSVIGKTFTVPGICWVSGLADSEVQPILSSLVRKEVLSLQADPRSPERGQYGFLQDLVKWVAYETLSKRERKAKHIAAAEFIESTWTGDEDEIVEVVAAHYLEAYRSSPDASDAEEIKSRTREMLVRAGERAASLAAPNEAQLYFEQAIDLTDDPPMQAELYERSGMMARAEGRAEEATSHFDRAISLFQESGATHPAARVSARLGEVMWDRGRLKEALDSMDRSFQVLSVEEPDEDLATLAAQVGRFMFFSGETDVAAERIEVALDMAESLWLPEVLSQALNTKAIILNTWGRRRESLALLKYALDVALEHDKPSAALRAYYNLADMTAHVDRYREAEEFVRSGLTLARRVGNRFWEWNFLGQVYPLFALAKWDEIVGMTAELPEERWSEARGAFTGYMGPLELIHVHRGEGDEAARIIDLFAELATSADVQERGYFSLGQAISWFDQGRFAESMEASDRALAAREAVGVTHESVKEAFVIGLESALALDDLAKAQELLGLIEGLPPGRVPQYLQAQGMRFRARLSARRAETELVESGFKGAAGLFRELAVPFSMAVTLLEHSEWLASQQRASETEPLLVEAREIFERLKALPWLERLDRLAGDRASTL